MIFAIYTILFLLIVLTVTIIFYRHKISTLNESIKAQRETVTIGLSNLHNGLLRKYGSDYLYSISNAPLNDYLDEKLLPHRAFGEDCYTFYLSSYPSINSSRVQKFHTQCCRLEWKNYTINAYEIKKHRKINFEPCQYCCGKLPLVEWVDRYRGHYTFLKEYIDIDAKKHFEHTLKINRRDWIDKY